MSKPKVVRKVQTGRSKSTLNRAKPTQLRRNISSKNLSTGFRLPNNFVFRFVKKFEPEKKVR